MEPTSKCLRVMLSGFLLLLASHSLAARYELQVDSGDPTRGTVRLVLDEPLPEDTAFFTRQLGDSINLENPRCEGTAEPLARSDTIWTASKGCASLTWTTSFKLVAEPAVDVSKQMNIYHPSGWWLFSEWGNLLRPRSGKIDMRLCIANKPAGPCRPIPATNGPPLFMIVGEEQATLTLDGVTLRFFTGHLPNNFDVIALYESYGRQLSYLSSVTAAKQSAVGRQRNIDVLLLGIDASRDTTGGAAGSDTFLTNVVVDDGEVSTSERVRLLWISGHELSHMLGVGTEVLWASESLAHYYGFKSLAKGEEAEELFKGLVRNAGNMGLLEAHRRVMEEGNGQYYGLFYSRGAAFWRAVDNRLSAATKGERNLDELLPLLLNGEFCADGELPKEFVEAVSDIVGTESFKKILAEYL